MIMQIYLILEQGILLPLCVKWKLGELSYVCYCVACYQKHIIVINSV